MRVRRLTPPSWAAVVANVAWWAAVHSTTGYVAHRTPAARLQDDGPLPALRSWERDGRTYERMRIRRWKDRLPEAGALFAGGISKAHLVVLDRTGVETLVVETRRAERAHWMAMAGGPPAALWNPPLGAGLMIAYGVLANAPFIAVQRYNRARATRALDRITGRSIP